MLGFPDDIFCVTGWVQYMPQSSAILCPSRAMMESEAFPVFCCSSDYPFIAAFMLSVDDQLEGFFKVLG